MGSLELNLPAGWTKRVDPVPNVADPRVIVAAGTWDFPTGGECGPEPALADLPGDGALVWVDEYASPQDAADFESGGAPTRIDLQTPPARWVCAASAPSRMYLFGDGGRFFEVHVALGPDASSTTVAEVEALLSSLHAPPKG